MHLVVHAHISLHNEVKIILVKKLNLHVSDFHKKIMKYTKDQKVPGLKDPEGPGTKKSQDLTSPNVLVLENWKSLGTMKTLFVI